MIAFPVSKVEAICDKVCRWLTDISRVLSNYEGDHSIWTIITRRIPPIDRSYSGLIRSSLASNVQLLFLSFLAAYDKSLPSHIIYLI